MKRHTVSIFAAAICALSTAAQAADQSDAYMPPATIPHSIKHMMPITADRNACTICHLPAKEGEKLYRNTPARLPKSHLSDGKLNPARNECTLCHVPEKMS